VLAGRAPWRDWRIGNGTFAEDDRRSGRARSGYPEADHAASLDDAISEFSRFYLERRELEMRAAGEDERKRKKLQDEFTPRLEVTLVGQGKLYREGFS
jgi:hypothetical protein